MDSLGGVKVKQCVEVTDKEAARLLKKFLNSQNRGHGDEESHTLAVQQEVETQLQLILSHLQSTGSS
ncbi:hypothetical protein H257_09818 [Aphanomyces astaci]|nr:hypothetical protein H257_09818 [Aphanomyces astaci]ETV75838.1 hypothetical protein H257_09818 [Aphanomyces astaci]RHY54602.1 hypothetical protein DYB34_010591 [Aphanomyces astaci]RHY66608.1 hypothetical protein DYB38_001838 [Aphanomyces astaci]RLO00542.1 hypothetical protein DYB28_010778 [Aphanomyces astaci]RQM31376.1 hypothetical protein B5M09_013808 [Aphanomyces astaci]|eukprot:XP_009834480.1 hypothetical protein H257_09818 [Aphanomyces astaci]